VKFIKKSKGRVGPYFFAWNSNFVLELLKQEIEMKKETWVDESEKRSDLIWIFERIVFLLALIVVLLDVLFWRG